jgi:hypothetical protein
MILVSYAPPWHYVRWWRWIIGAHRLRQFQDGTYLTARSYFQLDHEHAKFAFSFTVCGFSFDCLLRLGRDGQ